MDFEIFWHQMFFMARQCALISRSRSQNWVKINVTKENIIVVCSGYNSIMHGYILNQGTFFRKMLCDARMYINISKGQGRNLGTKKVKTGTF